MRTGSSPTSCDNDFNGEVEDYNVGITKSAFIQASNPVVIDRNSEISFNAYPNPAFDKLILQFNGWEGNKVVRLFDMTGRTILIQTSSDATVEIDVSTYPKGIYLLDVNNGIYRENKKISIQ